MCICDIYRYSHIFALNSHWTYSGPFYLPSLVYISIYFYTSIMDTTYYSNILIEILSLLDCDVKNFDFNHLSRISSSIILNTFEN